jgi:ribosomal protein L21E
VDEKKPASGLRRVMPKFKKGDKVRVRLDTSSPYRGRIGTVDEEPAKDSYGFWYMVKFESEGFRRSYRFLERDLEAVSV